MGNNQIHPAFLGVGTIVVVKVKGTFGLIEHFGLVSAMRTTDGLPIIISNSKSRGQPVTESWDQFTEGQQYDRAYYPSELQPEIVLCNAYAMFGKRYDLVSWNCEHFVNACHGLPVTSKQVAGFVIAAAVGGLALAVAQN